MEKEEIKEIGLDTKGHLYILPTTSSFPFVYRDASGVRWDETKKALVAFEPERWGTLDLYSQILSAVKNEYGCILFISNETLWHNVPELTRDQIVLGC